MGWSGLASKVLAILGPVIVKLWHNVWCVAASRKGGLKTIVTMNYGVSRSAIALALAALIVASCGGGGGGGGSNPAVPARLAQPTGSEYDSSFGLRQSNAVMVYTDAIRAGGYTGDRVVLGQVDGGTYWSGSGGAALTHVELQGRLITTPTDPGARTHDTGELVPADGSIHGVSVAGMMVANRDNRGVHGVAPSARLRIFTIGTATLPRLTPGNYEAFSLSLLRTHQAFLTSTVSSFTSSDVLAVNHSWGVEGIVTNTIYGETQIRNALPNFIAALAQAGTAAADKKIMVWTTGNANGESRSDGTTVDARDPELFGGLPHFISELRGHSLAVASVNSSGVISSFGNRCGVAADFCLVAPGELAGTGWRAVSHGSYRDNTQLYRSDGDGSSFSAPLVTGALALLKERFPTMGNHELVSRLLATATKTGRYADRSIYGQGLLNVDASLTMAVAPISIHLGRSLSDSAAYGLAGSALDLSSPLSALGAAAASHEIEAYDTLGTPFKYSLRSFLSSEGGSDDALQRLLAARALDARLLRHGGDSYAIGYSGMDVNGNHAYGSKLWFRLGDNGFWFGSGPGARSHHAEPMFSGIHGFSSPFTGMAEGGFALGMEGKAFADSVWQLESYVPGTHHSSLDSVNTLGLVASLSSFAGDSPWRFGAGMLREEDSVLSSVGTGAFGDIDATTWHGGVDLAHHFGAWSGYASGHFGMTSGSSSSGLWRGVESVRSSSWALGLVRRGVFSGDDAVGVRVVQTLRAEGGRARFLLPDSRDRYGNLYSRGVSLSAEPDGREVDFALSWQRALPGSGSFSMDFGVTTEPGHVAGGSSRVWGGMALTHSF